MPNYTNCTGGIKIVHLFLNDLFQCIVCRRRDSICYEYLQRKRKRIVIHLTGQTAVVVLLCSTRYNSVLRRTNNTYIIYTEQANDEWSCLYVGITLLDGKIFINRNRQCIFIAAGDSVSLLSISLCVYV